jgi:hypothetical protein
MVTNFLPTLEWMNKIPQPLQDLGQDEQSHQICAQLWPGARKTMANDKKLRLCVVRDCSKVTEFMLCRLVEARSQSFCRLLSG